MSITWCEYASRTLPFRGIRAGRQRAGARPAERRHASPTSGRAQREHAPPNMRHRTCATGHAPPDTRHHAHGARPAAPSARCRWSVRPSDWSGQHHAPAGRMWCSRASSRGALKRQGHDAPDCGRMSLQPGRSCARARHKVGPVVPRRCGSHLVATAVALLPLGFRAVRAQRWLSEPEGMQRNGRRDGTHRLTRLGAGAPRLQRHAPYGHVVPQPFNASREDARLHRMRPYGRAVRRGALSRRCGGRRRSPRSRP